MRPGTLLFITLLLGYGCTGDEASDAQPALETRLSIRQDERAGTISVFRENATEPLVVQNARAGFRPYLHPIMAPDGKGFAIEPLVAESPEQALDLASRSRISMISQFIARRVVDAGAIETLISRIEQQPDSRLPMLQGMLAGLEGQFDVAAPPNWPPVYARLRLDEEVAELATAVAQRMGDIEAARQSLATLRDRSAPPDRRRQALNTLAGQRRQELVEELPDLLNEPLLRNNAIRAIAAFESQELGRRLLDVYHSFSSAEKLEAVQTMASRPVYGRMLTEALKNGTIPRRDVLPSKS